MEPYKTHGEFFYSDMTSSNKLDGVGPVDNRLKMESAGWKS